MPAWRTGHVAEVAKQPWRICRGCPAQAPCLAWALDHGITDGVWGGTTEDQRRAIRSLAQAMPNGQEDDDARLARPPATRDAHQRAASSS